MDLEEFPLDIEDLTLIVRMIQPVEEVIVVSVTEPAVLSISPAPHRPALHQRQRMVGAGANRNTLFLHQPHDVL